MRWRNAVTGLTVESDEILDYPYEREGHPHTDENCWCGQHDAADSTECHCGRSFKTAQGLFQHQRRTHAE